MKTFPYNETEYAEFERRAAAAGWRLDTSPETEMSRHTFWWSDSLLARRYEDSLFDELMADYPSQ